MCVRARGWGIEQIRIHTFEHNNTWIYTNFQHQNGNVRFFLRGCANVVDSKFFRNVCVFVDMFVFFVPCECKCVSLSLWVYLLTLILAFWIRKSWISINGRERTVRVCAFTVHAPTTPRTSDTQICVASERTNERLNEETWLNDRTKEKNAAALISNNWYAGKWNVHHISFHFIAIFSVCISRSHICVYLERFTGDNSSQSKNNTRCGLRSE